MGGEAEPVAQRARQRPGAGGGADQSERRDLERNGRGARTLSDDDIDAEVLHREIEHLLGGPCDAVDLVDEQHVVLDEVRQHRGQITRAFQRGPEVTRSEVPSSAAMIIASEVLPRPGGPDNRM